MRPAGTGTIVQHLVLLADTDVEVDESCARRDQDTSGESEAQRAGYDPEQNFGFEQILSKAQCVFLKLQYPACSCTKADNT